MSDSHANWLRRAAKQIAKAGHYGWGNTCEDAAEHIDALEAELAALRAQEAKYQKAIEYAEECFRDAESRANEATAELAALRIENDALKAERDKLLGRRDELREIAEAINDPRIHNTMTIAEWCREASWMKGERHELQRYGIEWTGPSTPICVEKADGYWTPWHVAQTELTALHIENDALRAALGENQ